MNCSNDLPSPQAFGAAGEPRGATDWRDENLGRPGNESVCLLQWHGASLVLVTGYEIQPAGFLPAGSADTAIVVLKGDLVFRDGPQTCASGPGGNGRQTGVARRGDVALFPRGVAVSLEVLSASAAALQMRFPPAFARDTLGLFDERPFVQQFGQADPFFFSAAEQLIALHESPTHISALVMDSLFRTLALHLFARYGEGSATPLPPLSQRLTTSRARQVQRYIDDELDHRLSRDVLARQAGCEPRALTAAFRNTFGKSPAQYVIDRRLDRASQLIRDTSLDLADIALRSGFSSQSHLTTALRKRRGVTPFELRRTSAGSWPLGSSRRR